LQQPAHELSFQAQQLGLLHETVARIGQLTGLLGIVSHGEQDEAGQAMEDLEMPPLKAQCPHQPLAMKMEIAWRPFVGVAGIACLSMS